MWETVTFSVSVMVVPLFLTCLFNGNSVCNGYMLVNMTENAVILQYDFSLSDNRFSVIYWREKSLLPTVMAYLEPCGVSPNNLFMSH